MLSEEEIWWRSNDASNSVGNLVLHLDGNVHQWIISGLGGEADRRERNREFADRGPIPRSSLLARLQKTVAEACNILDGASSDTLLQSYRIQGYEVTGLRAIAEVVAHFACHAGQIIFVTKLKHRKDLGFATGFKVKR